MKVQRQPITVDEDGTLTLDMASDFGNADWIRTARLSKRKQKELFDEEAYEETNTEE